MHHVLLTQLATQTITTQYQYHHDPVPIPSRPSTNTITTQYQYHHDPVPIPARPSTNTITTQYQYQHDPVPIPLLLSLLDQSWTEILNANFISIVPSPARILYIAPRTGVFTTYTKLNRGLRLRLQRGPELDGECRPLRSSRSGSSSVSCVWWIQPETVHATRCLRSVLLRSCRHRAAVDGLVRSFRADGARVKKENNTSSADQRRSDWYVAAYVCVCGGGMASRAYTATSTSSVSRSPAS